MFRMIKDTIKEKISGKRMDKLREKLELSIGSNNMILGKEYMEGEINIFTNNPDKIEGYLKTFARNNRLIYSKEESFVHEDEYEYTISLQDEDSPWRT